MSYTDYIAAIAQVLSDNASIQAAVDGQIVPGLRHDQADQYLQGTHHCCIGITALNENSIALPGVAYHGFSDCDLQLQCDVISIADSDTYAADVAGQIRDLLKKTQVVTINGQALQIMPVGNITLHPIQDDVFPDRFHVICTMRIKYLG